MVFLFACTIFLSAFLLFQVQPMIGKMILPWFGGSAAVWSTCMLFFQLVLFLGYLYAHLLTRYLKPRQQSICHIGLLLASLALLPIAPGGMWKPDGGDDPTLLIAGLMTACIGLPYFLLSSTGPLVQAWFAREKAGTVPYRLFALSNFGSMLGLLSYPLLFEPWLPLPSMAGVWSIAYGCFVLACGALAARYLRGQAAPAIVRADGPPPRRGLYAWWLMLAALPAVLLMGITSHLTQDIAPVPMLWVLPLVIYLATFILCFEGRGWYRRGWTMPLMIVTVLGMFIFAAKPQLGSDHMPAVVLLFSVGLFACCMVCHGELSKIKPSTGYLTSYYLMISAGGALGGIFVALVAPRVFDDHYELVMALFAVLVIAWLLIYRDPVTADHAASYRRPWRKSASVAVAVVAVFIGLRLASMDIYDHKWRNFYGIVKVREGGSGNDRIRLMLHGTILHGFQFLDPARQRVATTYYGQQSGVGQAFQATQHRATRRVGVVGLGTGTIATYCRPGDQYRFYEINPVVINAAQTKFNYLSACPGASMAEGDARLTLEREAANGYDVLVVDAFSSDAIPVHLLTREAFALYFKHLKPGGILAVHTTNKHLDLEPVVRMAADRYGKETLNIASPSNIDIGIYRTTWVLVAAPGPGSPLASLRRLGRPANAGPTLKPWTDDYSSIIDIIYR